MKIHLKTTYLLFTLVCAFILAFSQCSNEAKIQSLLEKEAATISEQCPVVITDKIRLDSCKSLPNRVLQYNYTLIAEEAISDTLAIQNSNKPLMINQLKELKKEPGMKKLMDNDVVFAYYYNNAEGKYLYQIRITPQDYKQ